MEGWRRRLAMGGALALGLLLLAPTAASAQQTIPNVIVQPLCPTVDADGLPLVGQYGVQVENNTGTEADFAVEIADLAGPVLLDPIENVPDGDTASQLFGIGQVADLGATPTEVALEDAVVTVTLGADTTSVTLNCDLIPVNYVTAAAACAVAFGAPDRLFVTNSGTEPVDVDVAGVIIGPGPSRGEQTLPNGSGALPDLQPGPATAVDIPLQFTHAEVRVEGEEFDVAFTSCVPVAETTTTTAAGTGIATTSTTAAAAANRSAGEIARTGEDDDALARVGTAVGLLGVLLLLSSNWWLRWFRDREALLADFQSWRMRGR